MISEKAKYFYNEMKITDKYTFSESWQQVLKNPELKKIFKWNNPLISCAVQVQHQKQKFPSLCPVTWVLD
jgi:hypothetical protein